MLQNKKPNSKCWYKKLKNAVAGCNGWRSFHWLKPIDEGLGWWNAHGRAKLGWRAPLSTKINPHNTFEYFHSWLRGYINYCWNLPIALATTAGVVAFIFWFFSVEILSSLNSLRSYGIPAFDDIDSFFRILSETKLYELPIFVDRVLILTPHAIFLGCSSFLLVWGVSSGAKSRKAAAWNVRFLEYIAMLVLIIGIISSLYFSYVARTPRPYFILLDSLLGSGSFNVVIPTLWVTCNRLIFGMMFLLFAHYLLDVFGDAYDTETIKLIPMLLLALEVIYLLLGTMNLLMLTLLLVGLSISLYVMIAMDRSYVSGEASLKYFSLSAVSTIFMFLGCAFIYFFESYLTFVSLSNSVLDVSHVFYGVYVEKIGYLFFVTGLLFKLSLYPCYIWAPDVYDGSSYVIITFMTLFVKFASLCVLAKLVITNILLKDFYSVMLIVSGCVSIFIGAVGAINEVRIKRFLAFTSMNQLGFIVLGFVFANLTGGIFNTIVIYLSSSAVLLGTLMSARNVDVLSATKPEIKYMNQLYSIFLNSPVIAVYLTLIICSMAGIPPFWGFIGKFLVLAPMVGCSLVGVFVLLMHCVGLYNYVRFIKYLWTYEVRPVSDTSIFELKIGFASKKIGYLITGIHLFGGILLTTFMKDLGIAWELTLINVF